MTTADADPMFVPQKKKKVQNFPEQNCVLNSDRNVKCQNICGCLSAALSWWRWLVCEVACIFAWSSLCVHGYPSFPKNMVPVVESCDLHVLGCLRRYISNLATLTAASHHLLSVKLLPPYIRGSHEVFYWKSFSVSATYLKGLWWGIINGQLKIMASIKKSSPNCNQMMNKRAKKGKKSYAYRLHKLQAITRRNKATRFNVDVYR